MYSFTRLWMSPNENEDDERREERGQQDEQEAQAVDAERVLDAESGIQAMLLDELEVARASASKAAPAAPARARTERARRRARRARQPSICSRGTQQRAASAPSSGDQTMQAEEHVPVSRDRLSEAVVAEHDDRADEERERVVLHVAGLQRGARARRWQRDARRRRR